MKFNKIKRVHIIGIGGCASSGIAEFLVKKNIVVTGSEQKKREDLTYLERLGVKIYYQHSENNIDKNLDIVLFTPAVISLNPNNPEIKMAKKLNIPTISWEEFIGEYFNSIGAKGITTSGSEGKGTTCGILTTILKDTEFDPVSILGARIKNIYNNKNSNVYIGEGKTYILEADEYNRNFYHYHPDINIMLNFEFEHPETYSDFKAYKDSFYNFFCGMKNEKKLILRATKNIKEFVKEYDLNGSHQIVWFGSRKEISGINSSFLWEVEIVALNIEGIQFVLKNRNNSYNFYIPTLPSYLAYNATGAIIAAFTLGLSYEVIRDNIKNFKGMVRRFDCHKIKDGNGFIITDYGHSPESIRNTIFEIRNIFKNKKVHLIFQPHLYSRTFTFFHEFVKELLLADKISLVDIYPAREKNEEWENKISSKMLYEKLKEYGKEVYYLGKSENIYENAKDKIDKNEITCFIGAGDMDQYYYKIINEFI